MRKKIIFGVDPGTLITGWGVIEEMGNRYIPLGFGAITTTAKEIPHLRYLTIFERLEELLEKYTPDALAVETQYVDKNVQSAIKLGMARGIIVLAALRRKIPVFEYTPTKVKQAVTGKGGASKQQVAVMVKILLHLKEGIDSLDTTDALAIAITHGHYSRSPLCMNI
jgi:crossover junction endodeoxyribonuclease RuvC